MVAICPTQGVWDSHASFFSPCFTEQVLAALPPLLLLLLLAPITYAYYLRPKRVRYGTSKVP